MRGKGFKYRNLLLRMGKTIGIVSLKGGVGKTTTVVSLGAALAEIGKKVLLIDGNLYSPTLGLHLNIIDPEKTLHDVFKRKAHARDAIVEYEGMDVMPSSIFSKTKLNPLKLKDKIQILKKDYDIILIDSSPNLNEETLGVILASDEIYVVTTADHATLSMTLKAVKLARQRGTPIKGIIINKYHNKDFETPLGSIEETLDIPILAVIPYDRNFLRALSEMQPFVTYKPKAEGSIEFKKLAAALTGQKYTRTRLRDLFRKMKPKKQDINRFIFYERVFEE